MAGFKALVSLLAIFVLLASIWVKAMTEASDLEAITAKTEATLVDDLPQHHAEMQPSKDEKAAGAEAMLKALQANVQFNLPRKVGDAQSKAAIKQSQTKVEANGVYGSVIDCPPPGCDPAKQACLCY